MSQKSDPSVSLKVLFQTVSNVIFHQLNTLNKQMFIATKITFHFQYCRHHTCQKTRWELHQLSNYILLFRFLHYLFSFEKRKEEGKRDGWVQPNLLLKVVWITITRCAEGLQPNLKKLTREWAFDRLTDSEINQLVHLQASLNEPIHWMEEMTS